MHKDSEKSHTRPQSIIKAGDKVFVVDEPYKECPFVWVPLMSEMCGKEVTISSVQWVPEREMYAYRIEEDSRSCAWCINCFREAEADIVEADADISILMQ